MKVSAWEGLEITMYSILSREGRTTGEKDMNENDGTVSMDPCDYPKIRKDEKLLSQKFPNMIVHIKG